LQVDATITVAPVERPTDNSIYELYFGNFPGFARVFPLRSYLYKDLKIHVKYITCPPGRKGGRSNFLFVGLPNREAVNKIIEAKRTIGFKSEGNTIVVAESQSMIKKNGVRMFPTGLDNPK